MSTIIGSQQLQRVSQIIGIHVANSSKICDQTNCHLKAKPIGVESCMA